jgi:hypothetical protein
VEVAIAQLARHEKQQALGPAAFHTTATLVKAVVFYYLQFKRNSEWRKKYQTATYSTLVKSKLLMLFSWSFCHRCGLFLTSSLHY